MALFSKLVPQVEDGRGFYLAVGGGGIPIITE